MSHHLIIALYIFAAVSTGLLAGIYFIFSNTVMPALAGMAITSAAEVMQRINRLILNPPFLVLFMGSAFTGLLLIWFRITRQYLGCICSRTDYDYFYLHYLG